MTQPSALRNPQELGNGLTIRWSTAEDTEKIAELMGIVWRGGADQPPNPRIQDQIRLHMRGDFPWMTPTDVVLVEDGQKAERSVVACGALWRKRWVYGDIPFAVGQPESIATHPDYRNRGLVRAMLAFVQGKLTAAEPWTMTPAGLLEHVALPSLVFLQLLFGYRSLAELQAFYPDVHARDEAKVALPILFPQQPEIA